MNYNNMAQKTNFTAGSDKFDKLPFYLTTVNIPGFSFSHPELGSRGSAILNTQADTITYNSLSFTMLVDEDLVIYKEMIKIMKTNISVKNASFSDSTFDFWLQINNNKGHNIAKFEFYNCRIESLGDIQLDTQDDSTEFTLDIEVKFDYFDFIDEKIPTLKV